MPVCEIIVAVDENGGFGFQGNIPWKDEPFCKVDQKRFQKITKGGVCVMGRATYEEIAKARVGKNTLLHDRECVVITSGTLDDSRVTVVGSLTAAFHWAEEEHPDKKIFILGGDRVFKEALAWADTIHMTVVRRVYTTDRQFPVNYISKRYTFVDGKKYGDDLYFITYKIVPGVHR